MEIKPRKRQQSFIINKQIVLSLFQFTPISAFLALAAITLTFTVAPESPLPFVLLLTPLYINIHSYALGISIIVSSIVWPVGNVQDQIIVRLTLIVNSLYLISSTNRTQKYRMMPSKVVNQGVPILL